MRTLLIAIIGYLTLTCSARAAQPLTPKQIAAWKIPCEKIPYGCLEYAICLNAVLLDKGIPSRVVAYHYGEVDGHAVVLFELNGKTYLIDNETDSAHVVKGANDLERVRSFDRAAVGLVAPHYGAEAMVYLLKLETARAKYHY